VFIFLKKIIKFFKDLGMGIFANFVNFWPILKSYQFFFLKKI